MRVLLIEDDITTAAQLTTFLRAEDVRVEATDTGEEALELVRHYDFDLVLLDLTLPDMPGSSVISRMRTAGRSTPILALCNSLSTEPRLRALKAGADDVVARSIDPTELLARMRAITRRSRGFGQSNLQVGGLTLDVERHEVVANGCPVQLTGKEFAILQLLMLRKNTVMTKDAILSQIYGGMDEPEPKIVDVFICKMRKKLASVGMADAIGTVWGRGYTVRELPGGRGVPSAPRTPQPAERVARRFMVA